VPGSVVRPAYRLYRIAWAGLDWLYPPQCGGCSSPGARWCAGCQESVQLIRGPVCPVCGEPQPGVEICRSCQKNPPGYSALRSWAVFNGSLRNAIHRLKYYGDMALGEVLARPLIQLLHTFDWTVDLVVPVPIGVARLKERGYNQANLIAWPLALGCGLRFQPHALKKERETRSQVGLSAAQRRQNVAGAFAADPHRVAGKSVLVVDDVTTSGATIEACAHALRLAGAGEVFGLTLSRPLRGSETGTDHEAP
jgi:competence protein ComFC